MTEEKLLSVIIPVYNTAAYLLRCISSIRNQSYRNLEILCVDNGSSDDSLQILREFEKEDPRITVLEEKKKGVSAARNAGIRAAGGEYITFVDSDDAVAPKMYETLIGAMENEGADIAHCGYRRYEPDGSFRDISGTGEYLAETNWQAIDHLLKGEKYIGSLCNKIYKTELFSGLEMDESLVHNEDFLLNFQLFRAAGKAVFLDKPFYQYYIRRNSASSSNNNALRRRDSLAVSEKVWQLFRDTEAGEAAANRYYYDLVCSFRAGVFGKKKASDPEQAQIRKRMEMLESEDISLSRRNRTDARLMKAAPALYRVCYSVYDRIRKPNWDVK
ncbi:MAG: glycosyltransferase family 2 protein [Lachnospiraceae bacterium]|nr:glycosyltransferase family 2 protein [Lachnospiraceae bacterium]